MKETKRRHFKAWVASNPDPGWRTLPLTHITKGVYAQDIVVGGAVEPRYCKVVDDTVAYFFYGRAAYRAADSGAIKLEAACPFCFVFHPDLINSACKIYPFDTGAFDKRMYKNHLADEMEIDDFSLEGDSTLPNKLISKVFSDLESYFSANLSNVRDSDEISNPGDLHARSYLGLVSSRGRNEADDRVCAIEAIFNQAINLEKYLIAMIVPHTLWNQKMRTIWLEPLERFGAEILPYEFIPGKPPERYQSLMEASLKNFLREKNYL